MKNSLLLLASIILFSCQQKDNNKTAAPASEINSEASESNIIKKDTEENKQTGDTIFMNYKNEKGQFVAQGSIDSINSRVYVKFKNEFPGQLNGKIITPTGKGNIRFNQIIFPDKSSDGPFGMDIKISLKQKGDYILIIGHSQMADNPYSGKFEVQIVNENTTK